MTPVRTRVMACGRRCPAAACAFGWASAVVLLGLAAGCASAPPPSAPATISYEQKIGWILRLEDQRVLGDPVVAPAVSIPARAGRAPAPAAVADLVRLLGDPDGRVRRRAALAIGHVGLNAGVKPLTATLGGDPQAEVRQMAAFALGLLGDGSAIDALRAALHDASPTVAGRAAEALATLGDAGSASAIGELVAAQVTSGALAAIPADDVAEAHDPPVEAFRLGVLALGRLKAYDALAAAVLDRDGRSRVGWWPVAWALQRSEDRRALGALTALARGEGSIARAFAARGLGALKEPAAVDTLVAVAEAWPRDIRAAISAVHALAQIGDRRAGPVLTTLLQTKGLDPLLQLEVIAALGALRATGASEPLLDSVSHPSPAVRSAAFKALCEIDPQYFLMVLSGLDADRHWSVRATLASLLGTLDRDVAAPRLMAMLKDTDVRVVPSVLASLVKLKVPGTDRLLLERLSDADVVVRAAAAAGIGELKPAGAERALVEAFHAAGRDAEYSARAAMLDALLRYGAATAQPVLHEALTDKDWAVRVHAAGLLKPLEPTTDVAAAIRPAPTGHDASFYEATDSGRPDGLAPRLSGHRPGHRRGGARGAGRPAHLPQLHGARPPGLLQWLGAAPRRAELRGAGRRSARRRRRGARVHHPQRVQRTPVPAGHDGHGARLGGHRRKPVLSHALTAAASGRTVHGLRQGRCRSGCPRSAATVGHDSPGPCVGRDGVVAVMVRRSAVFPERGAPRPVSTIKKGATLAPSSRGSNAYRFLPAFLAGFFATFFAMS